MLLLLSYRFTLRFSNAEYRGRNEAPSVSRLELITSLNEPRMKLRHGVIAGRMRDVFATFNERA